MTHHRFRLRPVGCLLAAVLALAGCAATGAPPAGPAATAPPPPPAAERPAVPPARGATGAAEPERVVLPNGVVLISQEHRAGDVVALQLWVRIGGRDEKPDELGLSHYIEHMIFKGTPTRPPGSIDLLVEGLGGTSNAFTSYDYVHYDVVLPAAALRQGLELLADIAVNADFPPADLESEKQVVFEEMNVLQDDPEKALVRRLYELSYAPHPYGRPILGTRDFVQGLTREQILPYYRKYYVPRNMVLVVVGAVTTERVRPLVDATFGRLDGGGQGRPPLSPPSPFEDRRRLDVRRPEQQAYLGMAWRGAPTDSEDIYAVDLLTYILGDSPSSRLNQALRERDRLVHSIEANYGAWQLAGLVTVTARLDARNLDAAEASILGVIRRVREEGVTEAERQRAVVSAESFYAFDIETAEGRAKSYGQAEVTWTLRDELQYVARLRDVTAAQIQAAARKYLGEDRFARVRFVPSGVGR